MKKNNIKVLSVESLAKINNNIETYTNLIINNPTNDWVKNEKLVFIEKTYTINDIELVSNPEEKNKTIAYENAIKIYEALKDLPRFILTDEKFWLWLYLDKYYSIVRDMMKIKGSSTIKDHWTFKQGRRRGLFFGVLSRLFFRVDLTIDENKDDKYELTKWIFENVERFRNYTWRSYSSEKHLVRGAVCGAKRTVEEMGFEHNDIYPILAKHISLIGSVKLLDTISEEDISSMIYTKTKELLKEYKE